jgi:hypothetical protein
MVKLFHAFGGLAVQRDILRQFHIVQLGNILKNQGFIISLSLQANNLGMAMFAKYQDLLVRSYDVLMRFCSLKLPGTMHLSG